MIGSVDSDNVTVLGVSLLGLFLALWPCLGCEERDGTVVSGTVEAQENLLCRLPRNRAEMGLLAELSVLQGGNVEPVEKSRPLQSCPGHGWPFGVVP